MIKILVVGNSPSQVDANIEGSQWFLIPSCRVVASFKFGFVTLTVSRYSKKWYLKSALLRIRSMRGHRQMDNILVVYYAIFCCGVNFIYAHVYVTYKAWPTMLHSKQGCYDWIILPSQSINYYIYAELQSQITRSRIINILMHDDLSQTWKGIWET